MTLEEENKSLKEELQALYGKLGAQGNKQNSEKKYRELQAQLYEAYNQIEALEKEKRSLRDDFAKVAMQGFISQEATLLEIRKIAYKENKDEGYVIAKVSYNLADEMMKYRE